MIRSALPALLLSFLACPQTLPQITTQASEPADQPDKQQRPVPQTADLPEAEFITIQPGTFLMGSTTGEKNEEPVHRVTIDHAFELQETEVTQKQWESVMGSNPSYYRAPNRPVESVSWDDVQEFLGRLNAAAGGHRYRLPTEAEWEYAARATTTGDYAGNLDEMGFYDNNSGLTTQPVRCKQPNAWGLYDMHGNVWEWVEDRFAKYRSKESVNPQGPPRGKLRAMRGGGWHSTAEGCRSAFRLGAESAFRNSALGFRLVRTQ